MTFAKGPSVIKGKIELILTIRMPLRLELTESKLIGYHVATKCLATQTTLSKSGTMRCK